MDKLAGTDMLAGAGLVALIALLINMPISFVLYRFVALNAPPERRAFWTIFPGYIGAAASVGFGMSGLVNPILSVIIPIPGALLCYWWLLHDLRKGWIDNPDDLPEGVTLANSDWRVGLAGVVALIIAATIKVMIRKSALGY